jgi:hypothetical protein
VTKVATLADSETPWNRGGVKEFECIVNIDDLPEGVALKPGYTAEVSIKANLLSNVVVAPIQAVAQHEGKHIAYVLTGGQIERREVVIGENNDKFVEVKEGLTEGEAVCLDARARANAESQGAAANGNGATRPDGAKVESTKVEATKAEAPKPAAAAPVVPPAAAPAAAPTPTTK